MNAPTPNRGNRSERIAEAFAEHADVRSIGDLLALIACFWLVAVLGWIVLYPKQCFDLVTGLVGLVVGAFSW